MGDDVGNIIEKIQGLDIDDSEDKKFLKMIDNSIRKYIETGSNSRSPEKVNIIHQWIEDIIKHILPENMYIKQEQRIPSNTKSGYKQCDVVVYKDDKPYIIFPVKYIMSSYYKNRNNSWENIQGEISSLKYKSAEDNNILYIIPINIISSSIPCKNSSNVIKNMEKINYGNSFEIYESLKKIPSGTVNNISPMCYDVISYIIDIEQLCKIGDKYDVSPKIIGFNKDTPYRPFYDIIKGIIQ
jgi:hypothetical protein